MLANDLQLSNAEVPIEVTPFGITTLVIDVLFLNALASILVTLMPLMVDGITTLVSVPVYLVIPPLLLIVK